MQAKNRDIYSASSVIRTSIIQILNYLNKLNGRYVIVNMCLHMHNLPTFVGVADFCTVRSLCGCRPIAAVSFTKAMTKSKCKRRL